MGLHLLFDWGLYLISSAYASSTPPAVGIGWCVPSGPDQSGHVYLQRHWLVSMRRFEHARWRLGPCEQGRKGANNLRTSSLFSSFPLLHAAPNLRLFLFLKKEPAMHCVDVLTCESAVSIHTKDCDVMQLCIRNASLAQNVFSRTQRCLLSIPLPFPKQPLTAVLAWGWPAGASYLSQRFLVHIYICKYIYTYIYILIIYYFLV